MSAICTACLCSGHNLHLIEKTGLYHIYTLILNEKKVNDLSQICIRVCGECKTMLDRFEKFKNQVESSYTWLMKHTEAVDTKDSACNDVHSGGEITNHVPDQIKTEYDIPNQNGFDADLDIKDEVQEDEHCEPETFVKDLGLISHEKEPVSKVNKDKSNKKRKEKKTKFKKKLKVAKKRKRKPSSDVSVSNVSIDGHNDFSDDGGERVTANEQIVESKECDSIVDKEANTLQVDTLKMDKKQNGVTDKNILEPSRKEQLPEKPQCVECGKMFSSKKTYRYHMNVLHKGQNTHPCPRCGKVYQWRSNLGRHMRTHKARDSGELYCEPCEKRFASVATYRQHLRISRRHVSEKEFSFMCNECGKKFVNKTRLRDHIDWEHLNKIKFRCQLCNKPFKCHTSLYVHLQNVHRSKEKKDNLCHVCGKSYQNAAKLKYHIVAMHTSETPYRCAQCAAAFGWYSSLYRHVREVHYKMKVQPKKTKKLKKLGGEILPQMLPQQ